MAAYYNEFDPHAAAWLRELIKQGHIAKGEVDERSIVDVRPDELRGFTQCHFFAGIGVWSHALRQAGWSDDAPVWTGSCPCQPFSAAGKGDGFADERHLWPHFHWLIENCRPPVVFGEQVASKDGLGWLDLVQADLEGSGYASGAVDTCAAGFGAPHIRQRLYWVAHADDKGSQGHGRSIGQHVPEGRQTEGRYSSAPCVHGRMADTNSERLDRVNPPMRDSQVGDAETIRCRAADGLNTPGIGGVRRVLGADGPPTSGPTNGLWRDADWLFCRDGKWRPVEPGTSPLAHGAAARVGRLRGYGNAIVAPQATAFIEAVMETRP